MPSRIEYRNGDDKYEFESNVIPGESTALVTSNEDGSLNALLIVCDLQNRHTDIYELEEGKYEFLDEEGIVIKDKPNSKARLTFDDLPLEFTVPAIDKRAQQILRISHQFKY